MTKPRKYKKTKNPFKRTDAPWSCEFCAAQLNDKLSSESTGWYWFTGYAWRTLHFCPNCRIKKKHEINELLLKVSVKPKQYPTEMVEV